MKEGKQRTKERKIPKLPQFEKVLTWLSWYYLDLSTSHDSDSNYCYSLSGPNC